MYVRLLIGTKSSRKGHTECKQKIYRKTYIKVRHRKLFTIITTKYIQQRFDEKGNKIHILHVYIQQLNRNRNLMGTNIT